MTAALRIAACDLAVAVHSISGLGYQPQITHNADVTADTFDQEHQVDS